MKHFAFKCKQPSGRLSRISASVALALTLHAGYAQIAINPTGATADPSAMLDVSATDKGFLPPRLALTATNVATPVTSPAAGLMVYNTATAGSAPNNVVPSFYFWDGSKWVRLVAVPGGVDVVKSVGATAPIASSGGDNPVISLNDGGVSNLKLGSDAVTTDKILNGTIINGDLSSGTGGLYKGSGSLGGNTTVTGSSNTLAFTSTAVNGFSVDGSTFSVNAADNRVGIGNAAPSTTLHVTGNGIDNPLRLENLLPAGTGVVGTLVTDANGGVSFRNASSISAVRVTGTITMALNNTMYNTNVTATPTETFDNLNEFSGNTFTAVATGLYQVSFKISFDQRNSSNDGGDGYLGYAYMEAGTLPTPPTYSINSVKVPLPEATGSGSYTSLTDSELVKLTAGQVLRFKVTSYGSTGNITANYTIIINRVD